MRGYLLVLGLSVTLASIGCVSQSQIEKAIEDNPDIVFNAIKKNPQKFMQSVQIAARSAQESAYADQEKEAKESLEKDMKSPRQINIDAKKILIGPADAPITIVKYADFQCPACRAGYKSLESIKEKYKGRVRIVHKNVPLESIHPQARLAAQIYESLLASNKTKALAFYNKAYSDQKRWSSDADVWAIAKAAGADKKAIQADIKKDVIDKNINADMEEHQAQGFEGTPAYIVNGVAMYGAQSPEEFERVIEKTLAKK